MGRPILLKIVSENRFSGKTYFIQLVPDVVVVVAGGGALVAHDLGDVVLPGRGSRFVDGPGVPPAVRSK